MLRWLIKLPEVARRSPAITTPPLHFIATQVVACGITNSLSRETESNGDNPTRRRSSLKLAPGSEPAENIGIDIDFQDTATRRPSAHNSLRSLLH